ncbi:MAG: hypothetical protein ACRDRL_32035, partial [Sciscionella sp.]
HMAVRRGDEDSVSRRKHRADAAMLGGVRPYAFSAFALFAVGILVVLLEVQSPSRALWIGVPVQGAEYAGAVTYSYHGQGYSLSEPFSRHQLGPSRQVTVYVNPGDPSDGVLDRAATRWYEGVLIGVWFVGATGCLFAGALRARRHRRRRKHRTTVPPFGRGLDPNTVGRLQKRGEADRPQ